MQSGPLKLQLWALETISPMMLTIRDSSGSLSASVGTRYKAHVSSFRRPLVCSSMPVRRSHGTTADLRLLRLDLRGRPRISALNPTIPIVRRRSTSFGRQMQHSTGGTAQKNSSPAFKEYDISWGLRSYKIRGKSLIRYSSKCSKVVAGRGGLRRRNGNVGRDSNTRIK